ncbi:hypothetical protein [Dermatobacter hominis]|uniref:hypothetical protein n=1 Tax=Dermatobacter hominis TaxID=2884263 RepID=UPI001D11EEFB|nr:hypothetical protein [Dermatobacter hominis]UDY36780.1 hypothetical protein LH044_04390 [Dermatobacter hominis]
MSDPSLHPVAPTDAPRGPAATWAPPSATPGRPADGRSGAAWQAGAPLGGVQPRPATEEAPSQRRDLLLTAILLVAALAAGATSLLAWRDVGGLTGGTETGWREFDGGLGRGWVAVLGGVLLAVAGVLVAAERGRAGRILAGLTGVGLMVFSVLEWGLGLRNVRTGPGPGLWMLFVVGMLVVVAVGVLAPDPEARSGPAGT